MITTVQVEAFLNDFKVKLKIWGVLFSATRMKNAQTLADLELRESHVKSILSDLKVHDYSQGPTKDTVNNGPDMWVFGKTVKGHEIYIKITMGSPNNPTICISFHIAEYKMRYPFR